MDASHLCEYLEWDSSFFGRRIARLVLGRLDTQTIGEIMRWCELNTIDCLYFLADTDDSQTIRLVEDHGFRFVDIRITLERRVEDVQVDAGRIVPDGVRLSTPGDVAVLKKIASVSHHDSRFYHDSRFPRPLCDALYETWIEKSCSGYATAVIVVGREGQPVGYVSCHLLSDEKGQIGLFGIAPEGRGQGLGNKLLQGSLQWFATNGAKDVSVVTQGRNCAAQRLYQRGGFRTRTVQLWYHRWFSPGESRPA